jgi:hypothetical protein
MGKCKVSTCKDGVQNGNETDEDCGGPACGGCEPGEHCNGDQDCQSGSCGTGGVCVDHCTNMVKDSDESDVDCGGTQCSKCGVGLSCLCNDDCESQVCCYPLGGGAEPLGQCVDDNGSCDGTTHNLCGLN